MYISIMGIRKCVEISKECLEESESRKMHKVLGRVDKSIRECWRVYWSVRESTGE